MPSSTTRPGAPRDTTLARVLRGHLRKRKGVVPHLLILQAAQLACIAVEFLAVWVCESHGLSMHWQASVHRYPVLESAAAMLYLAWTLKGQLRALRCRRRLRSVRESSGARRLALPAPPATATPATATPATATPESGPLESAAPESDAHETGAPAVDAPAMDARGGDAEATCLGESIHHQDEVDRLRRRIAELEDARRASQREEFSRLSNIIKERIAEQEQEAARRNRYLSRNQEAANVRLEGVDHEVRQECEDAREQARAAADDLKALLAERDTQQLELAHAVDELQDIKFYMSNRRFHATAHLTGPPDNVRDAAVTIYNGHPLAAEWLGASNIFDMVTDGTASCPHFATTNVSVGQSVVILATSDASTGGQGAFRDDHKLLAGEVVDAFDRAAQLDRFHRQGPVFRVDFDPSAMGVAHAPVEFSLSVDVVRDTGDDEGGQAAFELQDGLAHVKSGRLFSVERGTPVLNGMTVTTGDGGVGYKMRVNQRQDMRRAVSELLDAIDTALDNTHGSNARTVGGDVVMKIRPLWRPAFAGSPLHRQRRRMGTMSLVYLAAESAWGPGRERLFLELDGVMRWRGGERPAPHPHEAFEEEEDRSFAILDDPGTSEHGPARTKLMWWAFVDAQAMLSRKPSLTSLTAETGRRLAVL
jgi:hypothetical protein